MSERAYNSHSHAYARRRHRRRKSFVQQNKFLSPSAKLLYDAAGHYSNMRIFIWFRVFEPPILSNFRRRRASHILLFRFFFFFILFLCFIMMWLDFATFHSILFCSIHFGSVRFSFVQFPFFDSHAFHFFLPPVVYIVWLLRLHNKICMCVVCTLLNLFFFLSMRV